MVTKTARKPKESRTDIFVATDHGFVNVKGQDLQIVKGKTLVHRGHPLYKRAPNLFEPVKVHYPVIVTTTATPGEQRD